MVRNRDEVLQSLARRQQKGSQTHTTDKMFAFNAFLLDTKIGNPSFYGYETVLYAKM